jgi:HAD superfamily (subfamily IA) hydrolase, TIGR02254
MGERILSSFFAFIGWKRCRRRLDELSYELILFDADDTLFDYKKSEAYALSQAFANAGITVASEVVDHYRTINQQLWNEYEQGNVSLDHLRSERFRRLFSAHGLAVEHPIELFGQIYARHLGEGAFLIDDAEEICTRLRESGIRLAVITNGIKEVQLARIKRTSMDKHFEQVIVSEDAGAQKPSERIFEYAFEKLKVRERHNVLIVGDSLSSDIAGGIRYGIDTCWFNQMGIPNTSGLQPTYEIARLDELIKIAEGSHGSD